MKVEYFYRYFVFLLLFILWCSQLEAKRSKLRRLEQRRQHVIESSLYPFRGTPNDPYFRYQGFFRDDTVHWEATSPICDDEIRPRGADDRRCGNKQKSINISPAWEITTGNPNHVVGVYGDGIYKIPRDLKANRIIQLVQPTLFGHEATVAQVAFSRGNNGVLMAGVNWQAKVLDIPSKLEADTPIGAIKASLEAFYDMLLAHEEVRLLNLSGTFMILGFPPAEELIDGYFSTMRVIRTKTPEQVQQLMMPNVPLSHLRLLQEAIEQHDQILQLIRDREIVVVRGVNNISQLPIGINADSPPEARYVLELELFNLLELPTNGIAVDIISRCGSKVQNAKCEKRRIDVALGYQRPDIIGPGRFPVGGVAGEGVTDVLGTSFATPLVSGVVSLMLAINPYLSAQQAKEILLFVAEPLEADNNPVDEVTYNMTPGGAWERHDPEQGGFNIQGETVSYPSIQRTGTRNAMMGAGYLDAGKAVVRAKHTLGHFTDAPQQEGDPALFNSECYFTDAEGNVHNMVDVNDLDPMKEGHSIRLRCIPTKEWVSYIFKTDRPVSLKINQCPQWYTPTVDLYPTRPFRVLDVDGQPVSFVTKGYSIRTQGVSYERCSGPNSEIQDGLGYVFLEPGEYYIEFQGLPGIQETASLRDRYLDVSIALLDDPCNGHVPVVLSEEESQVNLSYYPKMSRSRGPLECLWLKSISPEHDMKAQLFNSNLDRVNEGLSLKSQDTLSFQSYFEGQRSGNLDILPQVTPETVQESTVSSTVFETCSFFEEVLGLCDLENVQEVQPTRKVNFSSRYSEKQVDLSGERVLVEYYASERLSKPRMFQLNFIDSTGAEEVNPELRYRRMKEFVRKKLRKRAAQLEADASQVQAPVKSAFF